MNSLALRPSTEGQHTPMTWCADLDDLPTVKSLSDGSRSFWSVPQASMEMQKDLELGEKLARQTLARLRQETHQSGILSRILQQAPRDCLIATGFRHFIERELLG